MSDKPVRTPEEQAAIDTRMAKARAGRALKSKEPKENVVQAKTIYFDPTFADYNNFVEGLKIAMTTQATRHESKMSEAISLAEAFVKACQEKYPA